MTGHVLAVGDILNIIFIAGNRQQTPLLAGTRYFVYHRRDVALVVLVVRYIFDSIDTIALGNKIDEAVGRGEAGFQFGSMVASVFAIGFVLQRTVGRDSHCSCPIKVRV